MEVAPTPVVSSVLEDLAEQAVEGLFLDRDEVGTIWAVSPPASESPEVSCLAVGGASSCRGVVHPCAHLRRLTVARCRHLKTLIDGHESSFKAREGRMPRRSERGAMKPIYDEYRRLKQTVRGDAAMHIQCVFRGYRTRCLKNARRGASGTSSGSSGSSGSSSFTPFSATRADHPNIVSANLPRDPNKLKEEKRALQSKLKKYEAEFMRKHGRKVKYMADIEPVAADYKRYKELRAALNHVL